MRFVAEYGDYNFVGAPGLNDTKGAARRRRAGAQGRVSATGRDVGALLLLMIIAAETDEAAFAKWQHYKDGTDLEALQWQADQAGADTKAQDGSTASNLARVIKDPQPTGILKLIGSYESVARMLDEIAAYPWPQGRHADIRRFHHRHGAVRRAHPAAHEEPRRATKLIARNRHCERSEAIQRP